MSATTSYPQAGTVLPNAVLPKAVLPNAGLPGIDRPQLWFLDLTGAVDASVLTTDEVERAARFRFDRDRRRFVARRVRLRQVLAHHASTDPQSLRFALGRYGKPVLVDRPDLAFSTSSSGDDAVVAVGSGELGVDLEQARPAQDLGEVAARFFAPDEVAQLSGPLDFYRCWSRKEAYVKAIGRGLTFPLHSFVVEVADVPHPRLLRSALRPDDVGTVGIVDLSSASGGYTAALVVLTAGALAPVEPERRWTHEL